MSRPAFHLTGSLEWMFGSEHPDREYQGLLHLARVQSVTENIRDLLPRPVCPHSKSPSRAPLSSSLPYTRWSIGETICASNIHEHGIFRGTLPELNDCAIYYVLIIDIDLQRLIRFLARDGRTYYGDAILPAGVSDIAKTKKARIIHGDIFGKHNVTDQIAVGATTR